MSIESDAWLQAVSAFEDEFGRPLGVQRLQGEWARPSDRRTFRPPFDVYETEEYIVVKVEIAGVREEDFCISLDGRILHIAGLRRDSDDKLAYHRMEIAYGEFRLDIRLSQAVAESDIQASYDRGFLSVSVPRRPQQRRIPISEAANS